MAHSCSCLGRGAPDWASFFAAAAVSWFLTSDERNHAGRQDSIRRLQEITNKLEKLGDQVQTLEYKSGNLGDQVQTLEHRIEEMEAQEAGERRISFGRRCEGADRRRGAEGEVGERD